MNRDRPDEKTEDCTPATPCASGSEMALRTWAANGHQSAHAELNRRGGLAVAR